MKDVFYNPPLEPCDCEPQTDLLDPYSHNDNIPRRTSGASSVSGYCSEGADRDRSMSGDSCGLRFRPSRRIYQQQSTIDQEPSVGLSWIPESTATDNSPVTIIHNADIEEESGEIETTTSTTVTTQNESFLGVPAKSVSSSGSSDTLIPTTPMSPSNLSTHTLVGSTGSGGEKSDDLSTEQIITTTIISTTSTMTTSTTVFNSGKAPSGPLPERIIPKRPPRTIEQQAAALAAAPTTTIAKISPTVNVSKPPTTAPPVIVEARKLSTSSNISTSIIVTTPSISASSVMQKSSAISPPSVSFDRRPSVGYNVIPHAALCQHRYSLQDDSSSKNTNRKKFTEKTLQLSDEVNTSKVRGGKI